MANIFFMVAIHTVLRTIIYYSVGCTIFVGKYEYFDQ